jgi:hypothetical protein
MPKRLAAFLCLCLLAMSLTGCSKCGWLWAQSGRACHAEAPR